MSLLAVFSHAQNVGPFATGGLGKRQFYLSEDTDSSNYARFSSAAGAAKAARFLVPACAGINDFRVRIATPVIVYAYSSSRDLQLIVESSTYTHGSAVPPGFDSIPIRHSLVHGLPAWG